MTFFPQYLIVFSLLLTQIRRAAQTTMLAAPMDVSKVHLGPSAHALWVISLAMTPKLARTLMSVIPLDYVASTALMREALSAATARMVTLLKQTSVPARHQVRMDTAQTFCALNTTHLKTIHNLMMDVCRKVGKRQIISLVVICLYSTYFLHCASSCKEAHQKGSLDPRLQD